MGNSGFKTAALLLLGVFLTGILPAQEQEGLTFVAVRDTVAYSTRTSDNTSITINEGDTITSNMYSGRITTVYDSGKYDLLISYEYGDGRFAVPARDLIPLNTEDTFGDDILTDSPADYLDEAVWETFGAPIPDSGVGEMWVPAYYEDIMRKKNRNRLIEINPFLGGWDMAWPEGVVFWYEHANPLKFGRATFFSSAIEMGLFTHFEVKNIRKTASGYRADAVISKRSFMEDRLGVIFPESTFWKNYKEGDGLTLLLNLDGDYLDVSVDDGGTHIGTFMRVGREFIDRYNSLIRTGTADLTNVQWPRRANGSTDFSPPTVAMSGFRATHKTTDRLRVRETPTTDSQIVTTLDTGTQVQLLETGATETIGGISAPWVKVLSENGFTGWTFSGYLETPNPETQNQESVNANPPNPELENVDTASLETANLENPKSGFPVLPFAIIGGIILVLGIAVAVVLAMRRKGKAAK